MPTRYEAAELARGAADDAAPESSRRVRGRPFERGNAYGAKGGRARLGKTACQLELGIPEPTTDAGRAMVRAALRFRRSLLRELEARWGRVEAVRQSARVAALAHAASQSLYAQAAADPVRGARLLRDAARLARDADRHVRTTCELAEKLGHPPPEIDPMEAMMAAQARAQAEAAVKLAALKRPREEREREQREREERAAAEQAREEQAREEQARG